MKRLILLVAIFVLALSNMSAQYEPSILNLRMYDKSTFTLNIDGVNYNTQNTTHRIGNLAPGNHILYVYTQQWMYGGGYSNRMVYSGNVNIQPSTETFITVSGGSLKIDNVVALTNNNGWDNIPYTNNEPYFNGHRPTNRHYYEHQYNNNYPGHCGTPPAPPVCNIPRAMNDMEFSNLLNTIRNASFESTKLSTANTVARSNNFTTNQVRAILQQFSFESTKLDFAKTAYAKTIDKNNYYTINDVFSFSSSTIALNDFLASR